MLLPYTLSLKVCLQTEFPLFLYQNVSKKEDISAECE